jgi:amidophosphoribosyltransferase
VDTPERAQLLAAQHDVDAMARLIGVDSLAFISIDGLYRAMWEPGRDNASPQFCDACFTGDYPIALTDHANSMGKGRSKDIFAGLAEV